MNFEFECDARDKFAIGQHKLTIEVKYLERIIKEWINETLDAREPKKGPPGPSGEPLLTISDVAKRFSVTKTTVHNWRRRQLIVGKTIGKNRYFTEEEINNALRHYGWEKKLIQDW